MSLLTKLFEKTSSNNTTLTACQLLSLLKVPVSKTTAIESIEAHPNFPSLYSISDSLRKWKVENIAMQIEPEKLDEVPVPFVAHLKKGSGYFLVVTKVSDTTVSYLTENGKEKQKSREEFLKCDAWVMHEVEHVRQYKRHGFMPFVIMYLWESAKHGYHNNRFEKEARVVEEGEIDLAGIVFV